MEPGEGWWGLWKHGDADGEEAPHAHSWQGRALLAFTVVSQTNERGGAIQNERGDRPGRQVAPVAGAGGLAGVVPSGPPVT
jgi:hypothetical protein